MAKKKRKTHWKEVWISVAIVLLFFFVVGWMSNYFALKEELSNVYKELDELDNSQRTGLCEEGYEFYCAPVGLDSGYCEKGLKAICVEDICDKNKIVYSCE
ncbi:MAG: hypothetical protein OQK82_02055 [Candidatus Pacearchaeota archaeon]|nr:hypothetical protein [Candidatus Pacearchaeota archaeon]